MQQLAQFDIKNVQCRDDFDRIFVRQAIREWYDSEDKFTSFVRDDLRHELEHHVYKNCMPYRYALAAMTPFMTLSGQVLLSRGIPMGPWDIS